MYFVETDGGAGVFFDFLNSLFGLGLLDNIEIGLDPLEFDVVAFQERQQVGPLGFDAVRLAELGKHQQLKELV